MSIFNDGTVRLVIGALAVLDRRRHLHRARPARRAAGESSKRRPPTSTRRRCRRSGGSRCRSRCPPCSPGALLAFTFSLDNTVVSSFVQVSGSTPWPVYVLSSLRSGPAPRDRRGLDDHARCSPWSPSRWSPWCSSAQATPRPTSRGRWPAADRNALAAPRIHRTCPTPTSSSPAVPSSPRTRSAHARPPWPSPAAASSRVGGDDVRELDRPEHRGRRPRRPAAGARASRTRMCTRSRAGSSLLRCDLQRGRRPQAEYLDDHRRVRGGASRRRVDPRRRLGHVGVPRRHPDRGGARSRRCPTARRSCPNRDGHGAWVNSRGAAARRHRPPHPGPRRRPHRARCRRRPHRHAARGRDVARRPAAARARPWTARPRRCCAARSTCTRYGITAWQDAIIGDYADLIDPAPAYLAAAAAARSPPGRRGDLVGPRARARADPVDARARASRDRGGRFAATQREDHAGRRRRELHGRDARAVPRRPRALHRQLGHLVRRRPSPERGRAAAGRRGLPGALPRDRRPRGARVPRCRRARHRAATAAATTGTTSPTSRSCTPTTSRGSAARRHREHAVAVGGARAADGRAHPAVPRRAPRSAWQYPFGDLLRVGRRARRRQRLVGVDARTRSPRSTSP